MNIKMKKFTIKFLLPVFIGALGGFAYYYFIGCNSGTCPITSNPLISTAYGGGMGLIFAFGLTSPKSNPTNQSK
jgi:hypothetical protein